LFELQEPKQPVGTRPDYVGKLIPTAHKSYGHESHLRLEPSARATTAPDRSLIKLLGRLVAARNQLLAPTNAEVSAMLVTRLRHLQRTTRLSFLDPVIVRSILDGTQPRKMLARQLWRMAELPLEWTKQRAMLGVASNRR
jgi:site-specific DNA recombinase